MYSTANPHCFMELPLHFEKVGVRLAVYERGLISSTGIGIVSNITLTRFPLIIKTVPMHE